MKCRRPTFYIRGMRPGDLVVHRLDPDAQPGVGIVLRVDIDQKLLKSPWAVPWKYVVMWHGGVIKEHETGILSRIRVHEAR